jgi:hypothetical protein
MLAASLLKSEAACRQPCVVLATYSWGMLVVPASLHQQQHSVPLPPPPSSPAAQPHPDSSQYVIAKQGHISQPMVQIKLARIFQQELSQLK